MIASSELKLNENQIALLQTSIEDLYNIQDWETLTELIAVQAANLMGGGKALLFVFDQSLKELIPHSIGHIERSEVKRISTMTKELFGSMNGNQQEKYISQDQNYFFPYTRQNQFSGVLALSPNHDSISKEQLKIMSIFMQSVPIILENSTFYLKMQRKTKNLSLMNQLHQVVNMYSFQEILAEIVGKVGELIDSEMAGIMLYEPEKNELVLQKPAFGFWDESIIEQYRVDLSDQSNAKNVFMNGVPTITKDAKKCAHYNQNFVELFQAKSIVTAPLIVENKRIGVIHAINKKNRGFFSQIDVESLMDLAEQLGILLKGALQQSPTGSSQHRREEFERYFSDELIELLTDDLDKKLEEIEKISHTIGFQLSPRLSVVVVSLHASVTDQLEKINESINEILVRILIWLPNSIARYSDGLIIIIASHQEEHEMNDLSKQLSSKIKQYINKQLLQLELSSLEIYIGIGESVESIMYVSNSYKQAKQILNALPRMKLTGNIGYYPFSGSWALLSELATKETIVSPFLGYHLTKINNMKDAQIMKETVESYLRNNGQLTKAAEEIFVHPNTLKYRIEKVQDITGFDLSDSEIRLNLNLALRLEQLLI